MTRGDVTVRGVKPEHLQLVLNKLGDTGAVVDTFDDGFRVRVYIPYGEQWYGYLVRRLAERPANLGFFLRALAG